MASKYSIKGKAKKRTCKRGPVKMGEAIEAMLWEAAYGRRLDDKGKARAELIGQILFDMQNDAHVNADHPKVVKAYVLAVMAEQSQLDDRDYEEVQTKLDEVRDLLAGYVTDPTLKNNFKKTACSDSRLADIDAKYNYTGLRGSAEVAAVHHSEGADKLLELHEKFWALERLPENEAISLQLESEIYRLEHQSDEWPEVIGQ